MRKSEFNKLDSLDVLATKLGLKKINLGRTVRIPLEALGVSKNVYIDAKYVYDGRGAMSSGVCLYSGMNNIKIILFVKAIMGESFILNEDFSRFKTNTVRELLELQNNNNSKNSEMRDDFLNFLYRLEFELGNKNIWFIEDSVHLHNLEDTKMINMDIPEMTDLMLAGLDKTTGRSLSRDVFIMVNDKTKKFMKDNMVNSFFAINKGVVRTDIPSLVRLIDKAFKKIKIDRKYSKELILYQKIRKYLLRFDKVSRNRFSDKKIEADKFCMSLIAKMSVSLVVLLEERRSILGALFLMNISAMYLYIMLMAYKETLITLRRGPLFCGVILGTQKGSKLVKGRAAYLNYIYKSLSDLSKMKF